MQLKLGILGKRASTLPIKTFVRNELMKFFCYLLLFYLFEFDFLPLKSGRT